MSDKLTELQQDVVEVQSLLASATRKRVQDFLTLELRRIEAEVKVLETTHTQTSSSTNATSNSTKVYTVVLRNYSWDQSDKFLKIYLSLAGVQKLPAESVESSFGEKSLSLRVKNLLGKNYEFKITSLGYRIKPSGSYHKVKTDMIVLFASKLESCSWLAVTSEERHQKETKNAKLSKDEGLKEDPTGGLMNVMKQMYDEGDDEMKRMLNKTWYESQMKSQGGPPLGDLNL